MFEKIIFTSPVAPTIEVHHQQSGTSDDRRIFSVSESGILVDDDLKIPDGVKTEHFIEGFFAGCNYM